MTNQPPDNPAPGPADPPDKSPRRLVLQAAAVAAAGAAVGAGAPALLSHSIFRIPSHPWKVLTVAEATLLDAVCAQIIPTDQHPGAREAGCVRYIDEQLAGPLQRYADRYRAGLAALAATCQSRHQKPFEQLAAAEQIKLLEELEAGKVPKDAWKTVPPAEFFRFVCDHTMQGFYGSPRHGGNKNYASYRMLGLAYPNLIGQNRYGRS